MFNGSFSLSVYDDQMHIEECELSAFVREVRELYGPEQAGISERDWLSECDLLDDPPRSEFRNWHSVTIAATARLANSWGLHCPDGFPT